MKRTWIVLIKNPDSIFEHPADMDFNQGSYE